MKIKQTISKVLIKECLNYLDHNPIRNMPKLVNWAEKIAFTERHKSIVNTLKEVYKDPTSNWNILTNRIFNEINPEVTKKFIINFMVNASMVGVPIQQKVSTQNGFNVPWAILMDPTSACNLKCAGCWASEYNKTSSLSNELMDRIVTEGKELGIYMYLFSGGEPLLSKRDLLKLAEKHNECMFLSFTNATLVDEEFARELARVGNFLLAISVEGFASETDMRRGQGTYQKVINAMDILKKHGVGFGFSACYHKYNTDAIGTEEYIDLMVEKGCMFGWLFTYLPIGKDAVTDLLATPEQREFMFHQVRNFRQTKPIFLLDFWNDGEFVDGCIAGGRRYLHINSNGDVEPCAFIHYSNVNIKDVSLFEALKSPLFLQYKENHPFNDNHLRPCPLLDNPRKLKEMVHRANAYSTQPIDLESVDDLTAKTYDISEQWGQTADRLWNDKEAAETTEKMLVSSDFPKTNAG